LTEHKMVERDWAWPNRKKELDCVLMDDSRRLELESLAKERGLLVNLPSRKHLIASDFLSPMSEESVLQLSTIEEAWHRSSGPEEDQVLCYAWHLWRERSPRWESFIGPVGDWVTNWQAEYDGCRGKLIYDTWISIYELEKYWLNWIVRANGWIMRNNQMLGLRMEKAPHKKLFSLLMRGLEQPLNWYQRDGMKLEEVVMGQALPGLDWFFWRDELLMRFDESPTVYQASLAFREQVSNKIDRKACNKLIQKMKIFNHHFWLKNYPFVTGEMGSYKL